MGRISHQRKWEHLEPPSSDTLHRVVTIIVGIVMIVALPILTRDMFVRDIYGPLIHGDPVVRVNYTYFALPALLLGCVLIVILTITAQLGLLLRIPQERIAPFAERCFKGMYMSLILCFVLPTVGGQITEHHVGNQGYSYCGRLFELGVATFSRGYVNDPRLCVSRFELESSLERYGYTDALRRYRFGKEP